MKRVVGVTEVVFSSPTRDGVKSVESAAESLTVRRLHEMYAGFWMMGRRTASARGTIEAGAMSARRTSPGGLALEKVDITGLA